MVHDRHIEYKKDGRTWTTHFSNANSIKRCKEVMEQIAKDGGTDIAVFTEMPCKHCKGLGYISVKDSKFIKD